jgi:hypothetical protein
MDRPPNHEDANLILRLFELRREPRMREARRWFFSSFHASTIEEMQKICPPGSEEFASYRMLTSYWEMAASFVARGVLHPELFFDSNQEMLFVWERVRTIVPLGRAMQKNPKALNNLEQVATMFQTWWNERAPDFYPVFQNMVHGGAWTKPTAPAPLAAATANAHAETPHTD